MRNLTITFLAAALFCALSSSQDIMITKSEIATSTEMPPELKVVKRISIAKDEVEARTHQYFLTEYRYKFPSGSIKEEKPSFNIVSSFRSNIRFGGFWDKYAIINFTPQMFIKPFDFISIYANHNTSCFVPIKAVKEHFKSLAVQGAAVLAVDNSVKFLLSSNSLISAIVSFAAKNVAIYYIMKSFNKGNITNDNKIVDYQNYYYAFSVRF